MQIISTHDLARRSTSSPSMQALHAYIFQLTTSRGGRHFRHHRPSCPAIISTHDLTRRSTRVAFRKNWKIKSFNSRPHEEIDAFYRCLINVLVISTHDLARRSTTEFYDLGLGSSTFQLTTSRRGRLEKHTKTVPPTYFNSRPHKEVDPEIASEPTLHHISTHDLTRRSTPERRRNLRGL